MLVTNDFQLCVVFLVGSVCACVCVHLFACILVCACMHLACFAWLSFLLLVFASLFSSALWMDYIVLPLSKHLSITARHSPSMLAPPGADKVQPRVKSKGYFSRTSTESYISSQKCCIRVFCRNIFSWRAPLTWSSWIIDDLLHSQGMCPWLPLWCNTWIRLHMLDSYKSELWDLRTLLAR